MKKWILLVFTFLLLRIEINAQGQYFELYSVNENLANPKYQEFNGRLRPVNHQSLVALTYPGKSKEQLQEAVLKYLSQNKGLVFKDGLSNTDLIVYRDFSKIGDSIRCSAELTGYSIVCVYPTIGELKIGFDKASTIFSSINHAVLRISPQDDIASDNNVAFNVYKYVQPYHSKLHPHLELAYPESVYDENGKVVNPTVKKIIEDYYDSYVIGLKDFLDRYFK